MTSISVNRTAEGISLDCSLSSLRSNRRKLSILRNILHGIDDANHVILVTTNDVNQVIVLIDNTLKGLHIDEELIISPNLKDLVGVARDKQRAFNEFSDKARNIRNDIHEVDEFIKFKASLANFKRQLRPFQLLAAYHLAFAQNAGNFSVPGAGKTSVVLAAYNYLKQTQLPDKRVEKLVVVAPLAAFKAWKDEFKFCFGYAPNALEVYGKSKMSKREIKSLLLATESDIDIILVGYQSLASYKENLLQYLKTSSTMLVLDEAHRIKRVGGGQWANNVLELAPFAKSRVVLTGTPAPNGYVDLKNLFEFMWPSKNVIGYSAAQLRDMSLNPDHSRTDDLIHRLSPFFIRVNKKHLELPDATFNPPILVKMDVEQRKIYEGIANTYIPQIISSRNKNQVSLKAKLIRLRQAAGNPSLVLQSLEDYYEDREGDYESELELLDDTLNLDSSLLATIREYAINGIPEKFKITANLVSKLVANGEKAIIWCEFIGTINKLGGYLNDFGIEVEYLYGAVEKEDRDRIIEEFHNPNSKFKIVIANPHAVGESISLHQACHNAIYYEISFNAAAYMQSKDRIHRLGLLSQVRTNYYYILSENSIDETIYERVLQKEELMLELIESQDIPLLVNNLDYSSESAEDIKAVLRDYYKHYGMVK